MRLDTAPLRIPRLDAGAVPGLTACQAAAARSVFGSERAMSTTPDDRAKESAAGVISIGHCGCCTNMRRLDEGLCRPCVEQHGRRFAELMARVRRDALFARTCYQQIAPENRERFVSLFGNPMKDAGK
jgi:hypothetical protein